MGTDLGSGGLDFERHGLDIVIRDRQSAFYGLSKRPWKPGELVLDEKGKARKEKKGWSAYLESRGCWRGEGRLT